MIAKKDDDGDDQEDGQQKEDTEMADGSHGAVTELWHGGRESGIGSQV
ncbi:MAG: hypothetical protein PVS2B2_13630 [Candidatus Acidiferrum sp.]